MLVNDKELALQPNIQFGLLADEWLASCAVRLTVGVTAPAPIG
jgi:hypothetical protein